MTTRGKTSPTDSHVDTRSRFGPVSRPVTYQTRLTVEAACVRAGLAPTDGAAHQMLLRYRELLPRLVDAFHVCGAAERLVWFLDPLDAAVDRQPVPPCLDTAAVAEEETDGDEGTGWELYRANPCVATWSAYKRVAHRYIARLTLKLRAGDAKYGRSQ